MSQDNKQNSNSPQSFKDSLNLLKTDFSMRANSTIREPELQNFWRENKIDIEIGKSNKGEIFTLHDGPPYANGDLHMGHALNKILKDIINKYQIMRGRKVRFITGWDCHGLPIELKVIQKLDTETRKNLSPLKLRKKAAAYALKQVKNQMIGFKRWGVWADWENSYVTLEKKYEAAQIRLFGDMALKGYIYRGLKPVHWSPTSQTALAEAELEYPLGHISPSVYVGLKLSKLPVDLKKELEIQGLDNFKNIKAVVWTTTPWTLPANTAISVNESIEYAFVQTTNKNILLVASDLCEEVSNILGIDIKIKAKVKGSILEGVSYKHPVKETLCKIVIGGNYINTESGTGLVHTAPGHGVDDFNTANKYNLPVICTVDERGFLNNEAGQFAGLNVLKDANKKIIEYLIENQILLKELAYEHKYPYDWRTKKPTIFRSTEQWFASIDGFRNDAINSIDNVKWMPNSGRNRIMSMVKDRGDWCISRQRTWGVPIPVFYEKDGDGILMNKETIDHVEKLFSKYGADIWWEKDESELLPPTYSESSSKWQKGTDTMDVWFDSGSSWQAVCSQEDSLKYPADLYLEGSDQHRGWFQSSLLTSVAVNKKAPYKSVLTHGFVLDENGRKMSKSLGNIIDPYLIINGGSNKKSDPAFGADVLRLWVSSVDYSVDVQIGSNILRQTSDVYRKIRNTARYLLGNLHDFNLSDSIDYKDLPLLDKWMIQKLIILIDEVTLAFENFEFIKFFQKIQSFCVVELSNFYFDIAKDRLYVSYAKDFRRRSCQTVLSLIIENFARLIAPVMPHMSEDIWQNIPYETNEKSVFLNGWPKSSDFANEKEILEPINNLKNFRMHVNKSLEECRNKNYLGSSLEASVRVDITCPKLIKSIEFLDDSGIKNIDNLSDWLIISKIQIGGEPWAETLVSNETEIGLIEISKSRGEKCNRCWHYENTVGSSNEYPNLCERCISTIRNQKKLLSN